MKAFTTMIMMSSAISININTNKHMKIIMNQSKALKSHHQIISNRKRRMRMSFSIQWTWTVTTIGSTHPNIGKKLFDKMKNLDHDHNFHTLQQLSTDSCKLLSTDKTGH